MVARTSALPDLAAKPTARCPVSNSGGLTLDRAFMRHSGAGLRRRALLAGTAGLATLGLVGPFMGRALAEDAPKRGGTLRAAFSADPAGFDPQRGPSGMSHVVIE